MKTNKKRIWLKILVPSIIILISFKIYLEINNNIYENKIKKMTEIINKPKSKIEHKTLKQDGYNIHYFVSGGNNKEAIIFLHPAFSDHRAFDFQVDFFSEKYKVITIDLIGHGLSKANKSKDKIDASAKHINQIINIEGLADVHVVGVSMGSLVAQDFAYKFSDKVNSLTALGGYNIHKEDKEVTKAQMSSNLGLILRAIFSIKSFRKKSAQITAYTKKGQALFYEASSLYKRKSFMSMQGFQNIIKNRKDYKPKFPVFILTGEHDIKLAQKKAKEWHKELQNSEFKIINDAGHCANMDNPDEFNKIVMNFISFHAKHTK